MKSLFSICLLIVASVVAQADPPSKEEVKEVTDHAHLVGHEDAEMMARIQDVLAEWDPRNLQSPYVKEVQTEGGKRLALRRPDLAEFVSDPDAAVALGKALFWDMQAGSDFTGQKSEANPLPIGTSCATCHYRFGADARGMNSTALAYQAWDTFVSERGLSTGGTPPFDQRSKAAPFNDLINRNAWDFDKEGEEHMIVGSQGVPLQKFGGLLGGKELAQPIAATPGQHRRPDMFAWGGAVNANGANRTRQVTQRNSPSVINAVFNDRQFHDGRAESTFNGFSIFGDYDYRVILKTAVIGSDGKLNGFLPVEIAIPNASLASQAVGPIVNSVEMSYHGRTFHDIAIKLLSTKPLASQAVSANDSVLNVTDIPELGQTYRALIKRAFRREWWLDDGSTSLPAVNTDPNPDTGTWTPLNNHGPRDEFDPIVPTPISGGSKDRLMINNFSLYWGISIMLYESTLVSNESPFDAMMRGDGNPVEEKWKSLTKLDVVQDVGGKASPPEPNLTTAGGNPDDVIRRAQLDKLITLNAPPALTGTAMFQRGFRVFTRNCAECHEPPTFMSAAAELDIEIPEPIAKLHAHALVRTALADAFKERLINEGEHPGGVDDSNRSLLGGRNYFTDAERLPELEELGGPLLIENMNVPADEPKPLGEQAVRDPMITWFGTRPPLGFAPTIGLKEEPIEPYAFYDLGYYNLGVAPPRYDWGIWAFSGVDDAMSFESLLRINRALEIVEEADLQNIETEAIAGRKPDLSSLKIDANKLPEGLSVDGFRGIIDKAAKQIEPLAETEKVGIARVELNSGISSLGPAYEFPKRKRRGSDKEQLMREELMREFQLNAAEAREEDPADGNNAGLVDHSGDRTYLNYRDSGGERKGLHFFKRARRMVMTEENWGHRKHFITDNELMGWGAFKTPSLRNVALTEPYMHNGRFLTLRQVLGFYSFDNPDLIPADAVKNPDLHPEMGRLDLDHDGITPGKGGLNVTKIQDAEALLFFLHCLTDERVLHERAPFDHPSLVLPNGYESATRKENLFEIEEVGAGGTSAREQFPSSH